MSRREGHESQNKRLQSKVERERSPKRPRRDVKPATDRLSTGNHSLEIVDPAYRDQKHHRRLQGSLPLEAPEDPKAKTWVGQPNAVNKEEDKKVNGPPDGFKHSYNPTEVPRSRSYFQHDEQGSAGQGARSFNHQINERGRWSDRKEQRSSDRIGDKMATYDAQKRDEKAQSRTDVNGVWRHDGYFDLEAEAPPMRKRPAFREKKVLQDTETIVEAATVSLKHSCTNRPIKRDERGEAYYHYGSEKPEWSFNESDGRNVNIGDRILQKVEAQRGGFPLKDRFGSGGGFRGRERFSGRYGGSERNPYQQTGGFRVVKWKHDLYEEANRSPTPKNEEDQIAKVEALLAL